MGRNVTAGFGASLALAACLTVSAAAIDAAHAQSRVVNVYNWSDYIDPEVLSAFTAETGIRVVYDTYDNNEIVETRLLAGRSGYDIVVPSGPFTQRLAAAGIFQEIDRSQIPNIVHAWPQIEERLAVYDPGNRFAVNYMWGTTGIGVNVAMVRERLGGEIPESWDLVFDPEVASRLADCGIYMLDSAEDMFPTALNYLGLYPDTRDQGELQQAADLLTRAAAHVRRFHSSEYINALATGDICLAVGYSGDILQARDRAEEAGSGIEIAYIVPKEGAQIWFDSFSIPADADNVAEAHAFIDFMMRPEIAAQNVNYVNYASGNLAAKEFIDPEILADPGIYPDDETMERLFTNTAYDERTQRFVTRAWTRIRTGR